MTRSESLGAMEEMLGGPARTLREQDSRETVAQWTSLADVQIFSVTRSEFGIEPDGELIEAKRWETCSASCRAGAFSASDTPC
jgi:hypothetical protein